MQIKLRINGRDASPDNVGSAVEDAILATFRRKNSEETRVFCV